MICARMLLNDPRRVDCNVAANMGERDMARCGIEGSEEEQKI